MNPKISIIAPVYNVEKYLERFIYSIITQSYTNLELILIDDGSTDDSGAICDKFEMKDERIKVFHQSNKGVSSARNLGLDNCLGDYVSFVDTDDWLESDMYDCLINSISENDCDLAVCDVYNVDENTDSKVKTNNWNDAPKLLSQKDVYGVIFAKSSTLWNKLFKREIVSKCRFDEKLTYGEDMIFLLDTIQYINKATAIKDAKYNYVTNRIGNVVSSKLDKRSIEFIKNTVTIYNRLEPIGFSNIGISKIYYSVTYVLNKIIVQKPEKPESYLRCCQKAICEPSLHNMFNYCIDKRSLSLIFNVTCLRLSVRSWCKIKTLSSKLKRCYSNHL